MKPLTTILALSILGLSSLVACKPVDNQEEKRGKVTVPAKQTQRSYFNKQERMRIFSYVANHPNLTAESLSQMPYN